MSGYPFIIERYLFPEGRDTEIFLQALAQEPKNAEKVYERILLGAIMDALFLRDREAMFDTLKRLICDYSGSLRRALDFIVDDEEMRERKIALDLMEASVHLSNGRHEECVAVLQASIGLAKSTRERFWTMLSLERAISSRDAGRAKGLLEELLKLDISDRERALVENEYGKLLWFYDDYQGARERFGNFLRLADDDFLKSIAYNNLALSECCIGGYAKALELLERSVSLCEKIGDVTGTLRSRMNMGEMYREMGALNEAQNLLESVLNELRAASTSAGARIRADCYINLAEIEILRNRIDSALELCDKAETEQCGDEMVELRALLVMAKACAFKNQTDDAMRLINGALSLAESVRSRRYEGAAYLVRGTIQEKSGDYVEALQSYGLAILFFRKINNLYEVANTEERIGKLYERMKESGKAEEHKRKAKEITELFRART